MYHIDLEFNWVYLNLRYFTTLDYNHKIVYKFTMFMINLYNHTQTQLCIYIYIYVCTINNKINGTLKGACLPISKLHSIFAVANLLEHS